MRYEFEPARVACLKIMKSSTDFRLIFMILELCQKPASMILIRFDDLCGNLTLFKDSWLTGMIPGLTATNPVIRITGNIFHVSTSTYQLLLINSDARPSLTE